MADDLEGEALATLIVNKLRGIFNVLAVKAPGFGDRKKEMLQDIAIVTGATFIAEDLGKKLENVEIDDLGRAHRVVSDKDKTTIVDGKGDKKDIENRVTQLKVQIKKTDSDFDKEKLQERLGKLAGGVAVIKVGAPTEAAQKELKQRVDDAVNATRAAMEEGIVPGGGVALFNAAIYAPERDGNHAVHAVAQLILDHALRAPLLAIVANSGESSKSVADELIGKKAKTKNIWLGFNAMTNKVVEDLRESGIIDPLKVVKTAFTNAVSVAANYLTIGAAVANLPEKKGLPMGGMPGGMGGEDY